MKLYYYDQNHRNSLKGIEIWDEMGTVRYKAVRKYVNMTYHMHLYDAVSGRELAVIRLVLSLLNYKLEMDVNGKMLFLKMKFGSNTKADYTVTGSGWRLTGDLKNRNYAVGTGGQTYLKMQMTPYKDSLCCGMELPDALDAPTAAELLTVVFALETVLYLDND